jgi:predicted CXXCH cytochrome family protein
MRIRGKLLNVLARGSWVWAGLLFATLCVASPRLAQALVEAKAPDASKKGATYVGMETCATCHEDQVKLFKLSPHARIVTKGAEDEPQACETCHGPGSIHAENGGGRGNAIINPKKDPTICFTCHMEKKMEFRLPNHHPVLEGKMSCTDCHELHGPDAKASLTSMESANETCFKCHKDQQGPFVYEHDALKEGCTTCHKVHGSINPKMLKIRDSNLCWRCHSFQGDPDAPFLSGLDSEHSQRSRFGSCWVAGCHVAIHGSNFEKTFRY